MWLSIFAVVIVAVTEYFMLKTYRSFQALPERVKKYNISALWISAAVITAVLLAGALGVPLPGLVWVK